VTTAHFLQAEPRAVPMVPGMVSFVIPDYNHARYLGDAVWSALAQTYANIEVIVVDDGSTDDSRKVAAEFGDRIRYIYQRNAGLSAARNTGIQAAHGEYIALLDADDLVEPTYAQRLVETLVRSPDAGGAYCGFRFVDQDDQPLSRTEQRTVAPEELYGLLLGGNFWVPESLLVRRYCYQTMGRFDTSLRACEDWDVWLRFSRHYNLVGINDVLVRYRVVLGSMSSDPRRMLDNRLAVLAKHVGAQPPSHGDSATHQAYAHAYFRAALEYYQNREPQTAYNCLVEAVRLFPHLLLDRGTYYELACSEQTRGSEGDVAQLNIDRMQGQLFDLLHQLLREPGLQSTWQPSTVQGIIIRQSLLRSRVLWAIGLLHYQAGAGAAARAAMLNAVRFDPMILRDRQFSAFLTRSLAGAQRVAILKRIARR
jgi:glycosyltransferase involved in cell wall biosynthesis